MNDATLIPLEQLYLMALATTAKSLKLDSILQDIKDGKTGRLWLVSPGTTVPQAQVAFEFSVDSIKLGVLTRNERELVRVVKYAEGIDGFLEEFTKFMQSGRIAAPRKAA
jgi:hypothetical protein